VREAADRLRALLLARAGDLEVVRVRAFDGFPLELHGLRGTEGLELLAVGRDLRRRGIRHHDERRGLAPHARAAALVDGADLVRVDPEGELAAPLGLLELGLQHFLAVALEADLIALGAGDGLPFDGNLLRPGCGCGQRGKQYKEVPRPGPHDYWTSELVTTGAPSGVP
jgi:hypothetical protein